MYKAWLIERGDAFRTGVQVATLDPFHGYKNAIDDQLDEAASVLDAFHVVKLGGQALDDIRRRVQQAIHGHRGRKGDPLYGIRNILRLGLEHLSDKQRARITAAFATDERHDEVAIAWQAIHQLRSAYTAEDLATGKKIALKIIDSFPSCPIPEIARLGRTLRTWRAEFLAYFDTARSSNGGAEAINGLIELHRRIAEASGTGTTTGCGCSWSAEASSPNPTLRSHEPLDSTDGLCEQHSAGGSTKASAIAARAKFANAGQQRIAVRCYRTWPRSCSPSRIARVWRRPTSVRP